MKLIHYLVYLIILSFLFLGCRDHSRDIPEITYYGDQGFYTNWITIQKPEKDVTWEPGTVHEIMWKANSEIKSVKIDLYKKGTRIYTLATDIANSGSYTWHISNDIRQSNHYQVRISSVRDPEVQGESGVFFVKD